MNGDAETIKAGLRFNGTVTLGNILTIVMILISAATYIWHDAAREVKIDTRIENVENVQAQDKIERQSDRDVRIKETEVLDLLQQRLTDFPLHRHVGDKIFYPGGYVGDLPPQSKLRPQQ
jgi:hypothetical protein